MHSQRGVVSTTTHADETPAAGDARSGYPSLLVAIPALNEEATVGEVVSNVPRIIDGIGVVGILVVDDGSDDATGAIARSAGAEVVRHPTNCGVGAAIHTALAHGIDHGWDLIVTLDADGQFDPQYIPDLVRPVLSGDAGFSTASRFKDSELLPDMTFARRWGNHAMSRLISHLVGQRFHDVSCGMRCYSREAALRLHLLGSFTYTQEVFLNLAFKRIAIAEVPIPVMGRRPVGKSRVARSLFAYAVRSMQIILRAYRDYRPLRFFTWTAAAFASVGLALGGFLLAHYLRSGAMTPHKWAGIASLFFLGLSLMSLHIGVIGDMLNRHRVYLEEILTRQRIADDRSRRSRQAGQ